MKIKSSITASDKNAEYDEKVKRLLGQRRVLAQILVKMVDEFKGMDPREAVTYILDEPYIGIVPRNPEGTKTSEINENLVSFDIIFYVRMKAGLTQIIVNLEIQKNEVTKYNNQNRMIFYVKETAASKKDFNLEKVRCEDIKNTMNIWIYEMWIQTI